MENTATDRAKLLLEEIKLQDLAVVNSKEYVRWQNIKRGKARLGINDAEELAKQYPEYALWLITGKTIPEAGQISPEISKTMKDYRTTGTATD
jgi:hypothetical protein